MAAELIATLSAPQSSTAAASSSERMPPPTVKGIKSCRAVRRTVSSRVSRDSAVAVMSRKTISSAPASLCAAASSAGSPASRNCTNCMPFTTRPPWTSRQAMMRLASVSEGTEVLQNFDSNVAGLLRMKLQPEQVVALRCGRKGHFVNAGCDRVGAQRSAIGVREVDVRSVGNARQQPRTGSGLDPVPSHMWRFDAVGKSRTGSTEGAQAAQFGGLIASVEHPLQAEADSEHRLAIGNRLADCHAQTAIVKRLRGFEIADPGDDEPVGAGDDRGIGSHGALLSQMLDGLHCRGE